jgi:hypothetical protein
VLWRAHRVRWVDRDHLADHQPVEQHADRGKVLLDGRPGSFALLDRRFAGRRYLQRFDIGRDMERLDIGEIADSVLVKPGEERAHGAVISHPGVLVADRGGEEFEKAAGGMIAGIGDHHRHRDRAVQGRHNRRRDLDNGRQVVPLGAHAGTL